MDNALPDSMRVIVKWRLDDYEDGEVSWGELHEQRPDITEGEAQHILHAGFLYEHKDGTTVERVE